MGSDEMNLDLTDYLIEKDMNTPEGWWKVAEEMRAWIEEETKLTCSAGIGCNKMLAKIGSDMNKPNGQYMIDFDIEKIEHFMSELSIRKIPGVGWIAEGVMNKIGIHSCKEVVDHLPEMIIADWWYLVRQCLGISWNYHEEIDENYHQKSISLSWTFGKISLKGEFEDKIDEIAEQLEERMMKRELFGKTVTLELKSANFVMIQKSST